MKKTYQVAGHHFSVIMPDHHEAWQMMQNYDPFLTDEVDDCIFIAQWSDFIPEVSDSKLVIESCAGEGFPRAALYDLNDRWEITLGIGPKGPVSLYLLTDKQFTNASFHIAFNTKFSLNNTLMMMFAHSTARKYTMLMHASVTMHEGKGYLFLGKSGTGKSTHSQLWIDNIDHCELLNDDNPVIKVEKDGTVRVYGTPWSGKTPCYRNLNVPVGAIVDLHQAKVNAIRRQTLPEAYGSILKSMSGARFIKEHADGYHATQQKLLAVVPCYSLDCLPDADAAWLCHNTVTQS